LLSFILSTHTFDVVIVVAISGDYRSGKTVPVS